MKSIDQSVYRILIENFIKGGLIIGLSIGIIELVHKSKNLIDIFAFISGSFFLINLYQFYYMDHKNSNLNENFLYYSIWGGLVWVFVACYMYLANRYMNTKKLIFTTAMVYFAVIFGFLWATDHL